MQPLPATDLRTNRGTWAVPAAVLPAVGAALVQALPAELYDPEFLGQRLRTAYLDTRNFDLRKARSRGERYLTLRVRSYNPAGVAALSAKTEATKFRQEIEPSDARDLLAGDRDVLAAILPADLTARLIELTGDAPLQTVVVVSCRRYAREDEQERLTLDAGVVTDTGLCLPYHVLEFKATDGQAAVPGFIGDLELRPVKVSKFLWATGGGR